MVSEIRKKLKSVKTPHEKYEIIVDARLSGKYSNIPNGNSSLNVAGKILLDGLSTIYSYEIWSPYIGRNLVDKNSFYGEKPLEPDPVGEDLAGALIGGLLGGLLGAVVHGILASILAASNGIYGSIFNIK